MAIRTTSDLVGEIIEVDATINLDPFILAASILVDKIQVVAEANDLLEPVNDDDTDRETILETIETWLAAHFYAMRDARTTHEGVGGVQETYQSKVDLGLRLSHYGQMAIVLDGTGTLASIANGTTSAVAREVAVAWIGTAYE